MANRLKMAVADSIYTLLARGHSQRWIARTLQVDRATVRRYAEWARRDSNPAGAPPGSEGSPVAAVSNAAGAPPGSLGAAEAVQPSTCEPYRAVILAKLEQGLTAQRIWQDLVAEHGFPALYHSVRRYVRKLARTSPQPFRRMECAPGAEAQVDFGTGAAVIQPDGQRRRPHVFRIILSHSRKGYSEVVWKQTTEDFIRALENAFWHFGGVPKTLVIDNLKAAVIRADWYDPELNPKIRDFCRHYGTVILPTRPRTPRHKGKVEGGVKYVQSNALKARTFESLTAQNAYLLEWERAVADTRIHGTTCKQVGKCFAEWEQPALLPLPAMRFPSFQESQRIVSRDGHVEMAKAYYSVPPEYLGRSMWVRLESRLVRIFDDRMRQVTEHVRVEAGHFSTHPQHICTRKISSVERGSAWMLNKLSLIGPQSARWGTACLTHRGIEGVRVLQGLINMTRRHSAEAIEKACEIAHRHGAYRLRDVRLVIDRQADRQEQFAFAEEHEIIRSLSEYAQLVHSAFEENL